MLVSASLEAAVIDTSAQKPHRVHTTSQRYPGIPRIRFASFRAVHLSGRAGSCSN